MYFKMDSLPAASIRNGVHDPSDAPIRVPLFFLLFRDDFPIDPHSSMRYLRRKRWIGETSQMSGEQKERETLQMYSFAMFRFYTV